MFNLRSRYSRKSTTLFFGVQTGPRLIDEANIRTADISPVGDMIYEVAKPAMGAGPAQKLMMAYDVAKGAKQIYDTVKQRTGEQTTSSPNRQTRRSSKKEEATTPSARRKGGRRAQPVRRQDTLNETPSHKSPNSAFGNIPVGGNKTYPSMLDDSTFALPFHKQQITGDKNTSRTWLHLIGTTREDILKVNDNPVMSDAFSQIFSMLKKEVVMNTNGGTNTTRIQFTKSKIRDYLQASGSGCATLAEIRALQVWDPDYIESNQTIRKMKDAVGASSKLAIARKRLENTLAVMSVPAKFMDYYNCLFQTYKKSPVDTGVHQRFISSEMLIDMSTQDGNYDFPSVITKIDNIVSDIEANIETYSSISGLLEQKCSVNVLNLRNMDPQSDTPTFSIDMNAIFNNMDMIVPNSDNTGYIRVKGSVSNTDSLNIATPHNRKQVPIFVTSTYLLNYDGSYGNRENGFPLFSNTAITTGEQTRVKYANQFILTDSGAESDNWGFAIAAVGDNLDQISDYNWTLKSDSTGFFLPKGANVTLFEPTYDSTSEASKLLFLDMFDFKA